MEYDKTIGQRSDPAAVHKTNARTSYEKKKKKKKKKKEIEKKRLGLHESQQTSNIMYFFLRVQATAKIKNRENLSSCFLRQIRKNLATQKYYRI